MKSCPVLIGTDYYKSNEINILLKTNYCSGVNDTRPAIKYARH
jgi:hypothetical protein